MVEMVAVAGETVIEPTVDPPPPPPPPPPPTVIINVPPLSVQGSDVRFVVAGPRSTVPVELNSAPWFGHVQPTEDG
jgi:hypothetical protein